MGSQSQIQSMVDYLPCIKEYMEVGPSWRKYMTLKKLLTIMEARKQREKEKLMINYELQRHTTSAYLPQAIMPTSYKPTNGYTIDQLRAFNV